MPQVVHTVGVDAHGPNSHATLAECVAAASEGDMAMVLPGDYPERVVLPFAMEVIGRVKGKVRFCPPLPDEATTLEQEIEEDERAIAAILAQHLGSDSPLVGRGPNDSYRESKHTAAPVDSDEDAGMACSLYSAAGGLGGRLVDVIIEGGGVAVSGSNGTNETKQTVRPGSRSNCGGWTLEGVQVRRAPYDGLHISGGTYVKLRDCTLSACGGRGCVVMDHATLVAHSTDWLQHAGGGLYAGDCADVSLTRCTIDGVLQEANHEPSSLTVVPRLSLPTFFVFKRYVRRIRWKLRDRVGVESCRTGHGVMLFNEARLRMEQCFVRRAPGSGIVANQSSSCTAISSEVLHSGEEGVFAVGNAQVVLEKVTIDDAVHSGCLLVDNATVSMTSCTVQQCRGPGILAASTSQLTARGCTVMRNDCDGVRAKGHSSLALSGCIIKNNGLEAVHMASFGPCEIIANQLLGTKWTNAPPDGTQEQIWLRNAIVAAVDDGIVDAKELGKIMRCLKNAKVEDETQRLVRAALEDGEMDDSDRRLLMSICPKPMVTVTEWRPKDGGRGSEKLEASLRRERSSADLIGGQGQSPTGGGQPFGDSAVVIDPLTRAVHKMVTEDPTVTAAAAQAAASTAADAADAAAAAISPEQCNARLQHNPGATGEAPVIVQMAQERSSEEIQKAMEEKSKPVAAIWGNVDPRTQRRTVSR